MPAALPDFLSRSRKRGFTPLVVLPSGRQVVSLEKRPHTDFGSGILFYDDELDMPAGVEHARAAHYLGDCLNRVSEASQLEWLYDNPIWYWEEPFGNQRRYFCDICLADTEDVRSVTAHELRLVLEVVTTSSAKKERKDTVIQKNRNASHAVGEFLLYYPEPDDERSLIWHVYDPEILDYRQVSADKDGYYTSQSVPGLRMRLLPRSEWRGCIKVEVYFNGRKLEPSANLEKSLDQATMEVQQTKTDLKRANADLKQTKTDLERVNARAEQAKTKAKQAKTEAKQAKTETKQAKTEAKRAKTEAKQAKTEAKRAKTETKQAKTETKQAKTEAERAKTEAERAKTRAERAEAKAKQAETEAKQAKTRAERAEAEIDLAKERAEQAEKALQLAIRALEEKSQPSPQ